MNTNNPDLGTLDKQGLADLYEELVGYNIFEDDPDLNEGVVRQILTEYLNAE